MMKQNAQKDQGKTVSFDDFQEYHDRVMSAFQSILDLIVIEFGVDDEDGEFSLFRDRKVTALGRRLTRSLKTPTLAAIAGWAGRHSSESSRLAGTMFK